MTDAAFQATFSDFKIVKGRKVCQVVLEVALEHADAALKVLGGVPRPDAETWVGVARLVVKPAPDKPPRQRLTSERAAMLCRDEAFQRWIHPYPAVAEIAPSETTAAEALRTNLGVYSRRELDTDPAARARFEALEAEYLQSTGRMAHER